MSAILIRPIAARDQDPEGLEWSRVQEICCRTARSGESISEERWPFFGELWVDPYRRFIPSWTFVAEVDGEIAGYITGCPDTMGFEHKRRFVFNSFLLCKIYLSKKFSKNIDTKRFTKRALGREKDPNLLFSRETLKMIRDDYPAHLHVNVLTQFRKEGLGARLVVRLFEELKKQKISGLHLFCGPMPVSFYERQGMNIIEKIEYQPGVYVFALGIRL